MNIKQVKIESLRPRDPIVYRDNKILYIKNIYDCGNSACHGPYVVLEFVDDTEKCNKNYTKPEYISTTDLDYSVATPSIYPLKDLITVPLII